MRSGERRLATYALSRADAARAFPGAGPDLQTRELRHLSEPGAAPPDSRAMERRRVRNRCDTSDPRRAVNAYLLDLACGSL